MAAWNGLLRRQKLLFILIVLYMFCTCFVTQVEAIARAFNATVYKALAESSFDAKRNERAMKVLGEAAGVYLDKKKGREMGLERTVASVVLGYNSDGIFHYKVYFLNFLCFVRHFKIDLVVYILHHNIKNIQEEIAHLEGLGVRVITYPDHLFWSLISSKKTFKVGKSEAPYNGMIPSFQSFGALPMLVPTYEMLQMGFNVLYFDVDVAMVRDPIPFMIKGNADFSSSLEIRGCGDIYSSSYPNRFNWKVIEPNTGIMHVRSTENGKSLYLKWLNRIVDSNSMNDQRHLDRAAIPSVFDPSCNSWNSSEIPAEINVDKLPTYCFWNEILFQNGKVGVQCPNKQSYRDGFIEELWKFGISEEFPNKRFPVTLHANYVNGKTHELKVRGLWLLHDDQIFHSHEFKHNNTLNSVVEFLQCKRYNISDTFYHSLDWPAEIAGIRNFQDKILESVQVNGTLIKAVSGEAVYLVDASGQRRIVPNVDTFEAHGFEWNQIRAIPQGVLLRIKEGPPLEPVNTTAT